jgi:hypothetical protein
MSYIRGDIDRDASFADHLAIGNRASITIRVIALNESPAAGTT